MGREKKDSNTEWDFFDFVADAIRAGYLTNGDIFVVDNASVHRGAAMWNDLLEMLDDAGVTLVFLPTYSPELNPCELCFAQIKNWIRANRSQAGGNRCWT